MVQNAKVTCGNGYSVVVFEKLSKLLTGSRSKRNWHDVVFCFAVLGDPTRFEVTVECIVALFDVGKEFLSSAVFQNCCCIEVVDEGRYGKVMCFPLIGHVCQQVFEQRSQLLCAICK